MSQAQLVRCGRQKCLTSGVKKNLQGKENIYFKKLGGCLVLKLQRSQSSAYFSTFKLSTVPGDPKDFTIQTAHSFLTANVINTLGGGGDGPKFVQGSAQKIFFCPAPEFFAFTQF